MSRPEFHRRLDGVSCSCHSPRLIFPRWDAGYFRGDLYAHADLPLVQPDIERLSNLNQMGEADFPLEAQRANAHGLIQFLDAHMMRGWIGTPSVDLTADVIPLLSALDGDCRRRWRGHLGVPFRGLVRGGVRFFLVLGLGRPSRISLLPQSAHTHT